MSYLAQQPQVISFGKLDMGADPFDPNGKPPRSGGQVIPDGYRADRRNDDLFFTAQRVAREKGISFADAVDIVIEGQP